jgi:hypothetical protein
MLVNGIGQEVRGVNTQRMLFYHGSQSEQRNIILETTKYTILFSEDSADFTTGQTLTT